MKNILEYFKTYNFVDLAYEICSKADDEIDDDDNDGFYGGLD